MSFYQDNWYINFLLRFDTNRWLYTRQLSLAFAVLLLLLGLGASLAYGAADIPMSSILTAITSFDNSTEHLIIRMMRLPRALLAMMVGASLAVAGAISLWLSLRVSQSTFSVL